MLAKASSRYPTASHCLAAPRPRARVSSRPVRVAEVEVASAPSPATSSFHDDIEQILYSKREIKQRVQELAKEIAQDYSDKKPLILGVLTGAFCFTSDLVREMDPAPKGLHVDFIRASSYGSGTESSGNVKVQNTNNVDVSGRHVVLVEDILDTGRTLTKLVEHFKGQGAASVKVVCLLDKVERRAVPFSADYVGFEVDNLFVVGYGLDFAEEYRTLPYIGVLKPEAYEHLV